MKDDQKPIKMIQFIENLYSNHKILTKLTPKQSNAFQEQIISLLVDQNQNVDPYSLKLVKKNGAIQPFILQILGTVLERSPFSNQRELTRNISVITQSLEQKIASNNKKAKYLQNKALQISKLQNQLKYRIREYSIQIQKQLIRKLQQKQIQLKKRLNSLINTVKTKQKLVSQKLKQIQTQKSQQNTKKVQQRTKKKQQNQKISYENKNTMNFKYIQQIKNLNEKIGSYSEQIDKLKRKNKNSQLAYRKIKTDNQQLVKKISESQFKISQLLEKVQLEKRNNIKQKFNINAKQETQKMVNILDNLNLSQIHQQPKISKNIQHNKSQLKSKIETIQYTKQNDSYITVSDDQLLQLQCLKQSEEVNLIKEIRQKCSKSHQQLLNSQICKKFSIIDFDQHKIDQLIEFHDVVLQMIQKSSSSYASALNYFSQPIFTEIFQKSYINFQTNEDIADASTIIISRFLMQGKNIVILDQFKKAIYLRKKVLEGSSASIAKSNIQFLAAELTDL